MTRSRIDARTVIVMFETGGIGPTPSSLKCYLVLYYAVVVRTYMVVELRELEGHR